ncbi:hypothetical protein BCR35DRAFT_323290 [Leucosporidium creatinivorum]|uniref:Response regulatory domain-containing protein n=1 Tax=Leucosporidium creatinivorum TaxID=106004 RepID=A0A1Y2G3T3_9BASI|nr:hypothetical protein BCR35DRAFT_323290 [Leucosporidium creatinivorum]
MADGADSPRRRPSIKTASVAASTFSRSASRSTGSLGGDEQQGRSPNASGDSSPTQASPRSRRVSRRKSSAASTTTPSGSPPSSGGTFLSRFIGNFRSSSSLSAPRPSLARSVSNPGQQRNSSDMGPPPIPPIPGAFPSPTAYGSQSSSSSTLNRFRPSFNRRATTAGTPSPRGSPAHSPTLSSEAPRGSPGSPATLRGRERDPMETAFGGMRASGHTQAGSNDSRAESPGLRSTRRGSTISQVTLQAEPGVRTPIAEGPYGSLQPIAEPTAPTPLERPLDLIATLLPPALLLLSHVGPNHLFSPPLVHPLLHQDDGHPHHSGRSNSGDSTAPVFNDRASVASSTTSSTSSSFPLLLSTNQITHAYSHELHAPSTLSVPAVSAAAVWRLFRGFEWIGEVGGGAQLPELHASADENDDATIFDFPSALQGVADVLAADAGARGVELVIGQVGSGSAPSPVTTPAATEEPGSKGEKVTESRELLVRGDERAWSVVLIWILHHIIASAAHGATIEVRFLATAIPSPVVPIPSPGSAISDEASPPPVDKRWAVSLEILDTFAVSPSSPYSASTPRSDLPTPPFSTPFAKSFFAHLNLDVLANAEHDDSRSWTLTTELTSCKPKAASDDPSSLLGRRRATLESPAGQEPTMNDLKRFAEVALKGHKVALHAGEQSTFAKHLTAYLAGWGMDVSHVPLDSDDSSGGGAGENVWNKGRREPYGRVDSGFGTEGSSPLTPFAEPAMSPLASLVADNAAPSSTTSPPEVPSDLIIIDDDIATLRRLLNNLRAAPTQYPASMMAKRPQLATRRTRSSPHVRQVHQLPAANSSSIILHFASLTHYKAIKDIVQNALASSRSPTLPEVLVIPKPAGPRRIITALWTAIKRPAVDPSLPPIATSPTSPGVQYWTPRLSPALAKEQEFDFTGSETSGSNREATSSHSAKPRTPPAYFGASTVVSAANHPPSPLGKISDDQVSYFSVVADGMDGTTPSEGMVIQSPDGRPAIFFQPQTRGTRAERAKEKAARVERSMSSDSKDGEDVSIPLARAPMATPHDIGLGQARRSSASSAILNDPAAAIGTPALTLDSFITAAKSRAVGEEPPEPEPVPPNPGAQLTRQQSTTSIISRPPSTRPAGSGNTSPRVGTSSPAFAARRMTGGSTSTPPMTPAPNSPHVGTQTTSTSPRPREPSAPGSPPFLQARRGTLSYGKKSRKPSRKASLATVPPISVLIVEDNPINQTILSMFMKKKGIKYAVAKDGEEAVQKWKTGNFHLVLMDIQLPVKSGIEATREIREMERANNIGTFITTPTTDPSSPLSFGGSSSSGQSSAMSSAVSSPISPPLTMPVIIVALTASSLQVDRVSALAAGCNDFLTKPVSLQWLQQKLLEWGSMAYLSGFSLMRSGNDSPSSAPSISATLPHTQATHAGFTAGLNSKAEVISAHLHIDPRPHGRSPGSSPARSPVQSSSPALAPGATPQSTTTVHAIEVQASANGTASPDSPIPLATNPALTISSPTPIVTPRPPVGNIDPPTPSAPPPTEQDDTPAAPIASPARIEPSRPADLDAVEQRLEGLTAQRPGPSPLPSDASMSDLTLEGVMAEGARLVGVVDAGRSRAGSAGDSFSKVMHDSGTVSHGGSPIALQGEDPPSP